MLLDSLDSSDCWIELVWHGNDPCVLGHFQLPGARIVRQESTLLAVDQCLMSLEA